MDSFEHSSLIRGLQDRIGSLCLSKQWSDCVFKIGSSYLYAHRLILASASPVFEVMLYGALAEVKDIIIFDIDLETFKAMLHYIYTDKSNLSSVEEACRLMYASNKYMIKSLQTLCKTYIMKHISISSALEILDFAKVIDDKNLIDAGMQIVCAHTKYVFTETGYHPNTITMLEIAKQENINVSEVELFNIILQWSERECEAQDIQSNKENISTVLIDSGILSKIRFLTINKNDINNLIDRTNITNDVIQKKFCKNNFINDKSITPRKNIQLSWRYGVCQYFKSAYSLWIDENNLSTQVIIIPSKTVLINSFRVASRLTPANVHRQLPILSKTYNEKIIVHIFDNLGNLVINSVFNKKSSYNDNLNIDLHSPVVLRSKVPYTVKFRWNLEDCSGIPAQYPQQFVSDIGSKNGVLFSVRFQEATFLYGITYAL